MQSDGGPAFPASMAGMSPGMSLRDWFAGRVIERCLSMSSHGDEPGSYDYCAAAVAAYQIADAMLAERAKHEEST